MSADWVLRIQKLPIELAVGIYPHEQQRQPLLVDIEVRGRADAHPLDLDGCLDYEPLCLWLRQEWALSAHVPLLETRVNQLLAYLFALDGRIQTAQVGLYKVNMALGAQAVGIERTTTREAFEALQAQYRAALPLVQTASPCLT